MIRNRKNCISNQITNRSDKSEYQKDHIKYQVFDLLYLSYENQIRTIFFMSDVQK